MSRWGRGRGGSVAVPLDSHLFRENSNCPSAARSAGTVGKWGITSFTSIRSAPYAFSNVVKKPVQDQNSPLTVPAVETEQPPPKPKKFFKSRNVEAYPAVPQITYAPPVSAAPLSPEHPSNSREKKTKRSRAYNRDSSSPEAPRYKGSEKTKTRKNSVATKASKKEEAPGDDAKPPNKRYLVRNRDKVINYAEDGSNSPIPDFIRYESVVPKVQQTIPTPAVTVPSPKPSPSVPSVSSPTYVKPGIASPTTSKDGEDRKPPPIVLRISKGTSRIVSTDSNEGFTSPGSDRHSSMDTHADYSPELKQSPSLEALSSPKHEGLKITIKCSGLNQETNKKEKKKDKKEGHKSHKRHHKNHSSDDEPLRKPASPQPGSDTYDLYKTLASPVPETSKEEPAIDEIESQLAQLDSTGTMAKSPRLQAPTEPPPEPKPPESTTGRSRRNRTKINYSENDDYLDALTSRRLLPKPVPEPKKEGRKTRKKNEVPAEVAPSIPEPELNINQEPESQLEKNELIDILSGGSDSSKSDNEPLKLKISKKKLKKSHSKQPSPDDNTDLPQQKKHKQLHNKHTRLDNSIDLPQEKKHKQLHCKQAGLDSNTDLPRKKKLKQLHIKQLCPEGNTNPPQQKKHKQSSLDNNTEPPQQKKHIPKHIIYKKHSKLSSLRSNTVSSQQQKNKQSHSKQASPNNNADPPQAAAIPEEPVDASSENEIQEGSEEKSEPISEDIPSQRDSKSPEVPNNIAHELDEESLKPQEEVMKGQKESLEAQEEVSKPQEEVAKLQEEVSEPQEEVAKLQEEVAEPQEEVSNNQEEVFKPPQGISDTESPSEDKPCVKLVITKKKGSIFKSKSLVNDSEASPLPARKRRHLYKHEWAKGNETPRREPEQQENPETENPAAEVPEELTRVTRFRTPDPIHDDLDSDAVKPYTSVRCAKEAKEYYTVVRNVKKAHQIQEIGEFQEFNDDVEYLLDALQDNNPISTRCLSAITLASKCTAPAFRMHLRAHGTVQKFFSALHDATNDQSLGLCTATVMFVLSQDRLNMDLDRESLELMLNLLESDVSHKNALDDCGLTSAQLTKTQERVRELCAEIKSQGKAKHLDLENITVGHLAMETLLSLTSKRAGEWFKEELRVLGGIDHIVRTIQDCARRLSPSAARWCPPDVDILRKADRCMRVLENVTQQNEENQLHLVSGSSTASATLAALLWLCVSEARSGSAPHLHSALLDAALPAIKVLVNLTHSFGLTASLGAVVVGEQVSVIEICLVLLHNRGNFVPDDRNFEFSVCVLLLLINLVQNNQTNTERLLGVRLRVDSDEDIMAARLPALDLIVEMFYKREELAKRAEENTDALLDGNKETEKKQSQDDIDETVAKLLARAGTHMEHTMVGAYIALLLGHIAVVSPQLAAAVRQRVPSYATLLPTLNKYYTFLTLTASAEAAIVAHVKATQRIIQFMESSDKEYSQETSPQPPVSHPVNSMTHNYYQTSPSDMPQDMSINNLTYNNTINYSSSSSDRMSSSMEVDGYQ